MMVDDQGYLVLTLGKQTLIDGVGPHHWRMGNVIPMPEKGYLTDPPIIQEYRAANHTGMSGASTISVYIIRNCRY